MAGTWPVASYISLSPSIMLYSTVVNHLSPASCVRAVLKHRTGHMTCLFLPVWSHNSKTVRLNFTEFFVPAVRSSSDGVVAIRYVFPVLQMTSCFHTMGAMGGRTSTALCTSSPVAAGGAQAVVCTTTNRTDGL